MLLIAISSKAMRTFVSNLATFVNLLIVIFPNLLVLKSFAFFVSLVLLELDSDGKRKAIVEFTFILLGKTQKLRG